MLAITRRHAVHALLYLIVSLLAIAVIFYVLGAPFIAALELIIYAGRHHGAVCVRRHDAEPGRSAAKRWNVNGCVRGSGSDPRSRHHSCSAKWSYLLAASAPTIARRSERHSRKQVGIALFGPYVIGVELASLLLMGGLGWSVSPGTTRSLQRGGTE